MWLLSIFVFYLSIIGIVKSTVDYLQHPVKSCHIGDTVENQCNKCVCTSKTVFECTSMDCSSRTSHKDLEETEPLCFPNQLYVKNLITCICTKDGRWPHKSCHDNFQSLPPRNVITHKCKPDTYIPIDCNVCRCGPDGVIRNDRCTRNACEDEDHRRTNIATNTVFSKCEEKYWYSLAPCQFCFCVNQNKLVCNTGNYYTKNLDLGSYKLNICGKDLIKEAIELIPDNLTMLRLGSELKKTLTTKPIQKKVFAELNTKTYKAPELIQENNNKNPQTLNNKLSNISSSNEYYSDDSESEPQDQIKQQSSSKATLAPKITTTERNMIVVPITQMPSQDDDELVDVSEDEAIEDPDVKTIEEPDAKTIEEPDDKPIESPNVKTIKDPDVKTIGDPNFINIGDPNIKIKEDDDDESKGIEVEFERSPSTEETPRVRSDVKTVKENNYQYDGNTLKINVPKVLDKVLRLALRKSMVSLSDKTKCTPGATTVHNCNMCFCLKNSKLLCTTNKCNGGKKT